MQIFIHRDDQDFGPFTVEEAQAGLDAGNLVPEDHAWYEGASDWIPLEEIPGIMPTAIASETEPAPTPTRTHTGLPAWIPARRDEDPDLAAPTSFSSRPTYPIGITQKSAGGETPRRSAPAVTPGAPKRAAAVSGALARSQPAPPAPVDRPMPEVSTYAEDQASVPVPGLTRSLRSMGARNMIFGALWFVGGSAVTYYSYESALGAKHGGAYLVAWSAMGAGFIQFLRGAVQFSKG